VPVLRGALNGGGRQDVELAAVNRRGRPVVCEVTVVPRMAGSIATGDVRGAILLMGVRPDGNGRGDD
jgi:hypothetical protein